MMTATVSIATHAPTVRDAAATSSTLSKASPVTAKANGHVYGATFADYRNTLEPNVWMLFPTQIKWTLDGKPLADLKVTYFRSNPYVVFPIPDVVKQKSSN